MKQTKIVSLLLAMVLIISCMSLTVFAFNKGDIITDDIIKNELDEGYNAATTSDTTDDILTIYEHINANAGTTGESIVLTYGKYNKQKLADLGLYNAEWLDANDNGNKNNTGISSLTKNSAIVDPISIILYSGPNFNGSMIELTEDTSSINPVNIFKFLDPNNLTSFIYKEKGYKDSTWNDKVNSILILKDKGFTPPSPPPTGDGSSQSRNNMMIYIIASILVILTFIVGIYSTSKLNKQKS